MTINGETAYALSVIIAGVIKLMGGLLGASFLVDYVMGFIKGLRGR